MDCGEDGIERGGSVGCWVFKRFEFVLVLVCVIMFFVVGNFVFYVFNVGGFCRLLK